MYIQTRQRIANSKRCFPISKLSIQAIQGNIFLFYKTSLRKTSNHTQIQVISPSKKTQIAYHYESAQFPYPKIKVVPYIPVPSDAYPNHEESWSWLVDRSQLPGITLFHHNDETTTPGTIQIIRLSMYQRRPSPIACFQKPYLRRRCEERVFLNMLSHYIPYRLDMMTCKTSVASFSVSQLNYVCLSGERKKSSLERKSNIIAEAFHVYP